MNRRRKAVTPTEVVIGLLSVLSVGSVIAQIAQWRMGGRQDAETKKAAQEVSKQSAVVSETKELTATALALVNELKEQLEDARAEVREVKAEAEDIQDKFRQLHRAAQLEVSWASRMRDELLAVRGEWPQGLATTAPILAYLGEVA
jgi:chromosome segregation ATPase